MDLLKGAEILRARFERDGHVDTPLSRVDASARPVYRWCGVQPSPAVGTGEPANAPRRGRYRSAIATLLSR